MTERVENKMPTKDPEEGIYEVLDGEEEVNNTNTTSKAKRGVRLSGNAAGSYNTLHFEKPC